MVKLGQLSAQLPRQLQQLFDEWLTCTQMESGLDPLWEKHYCEGVKSALRLPAFKAKIEEIFRGDSSFFGYGQDFKKEIERLCFAGTGRRQPCSMEGQT